MSAPLGLLDTDRPCLVRYTFTDPRARDAYPDWERVADELVATLRWHAHGDDPHAAAIVDELSTSAGEAFTARWNGHGAEPKGVGSTRISHPEVGELRLAYETMTLADLDAQQLVVYLPHDDATAASLDRLAGRQPGALRAVGA